MNKILYITNSTDENNTLGYRHSNIIKVLSNLYEIDLLDFSFTKRRMTFIKKVINKLFIFPDAYLLYSHRFKKQIHAKMSSSSYAQVIICVVPFSFLSFATFIKKVNNSMKVIVDMTDPLTINVRYSSYWYIYRFFNKIFEERHLKNVNKLVVLNEEIKSYYLSKYPFLEEVSVLEQGINPEYKMKLLSAPKKSNKIKLIYAGIFYSKLREPFELYKAISSFDGQIQLSVFGSFKRKFIPPETEKFNYGGTASKEFLITLYDEFDAIVFIDNFYGLQIPGKILENLATCRPILFIYTNDNSPTLKYVKKYEGVFYCKNTSNEIEYTIKLLMHRGISFYKRDLSKYYWINLVKETYNYKS
jgi:hypothetical protein